MESLRREQEAKHRAEGAEQQAFGKQLANNLPLGRAQRKAHGEFAQPGGGPHQQQAGYIDDCHGHYPAAPGPIMMSNGMRSSPR